MDIKSAKEEIRNAVRAYQTKDEYGRPVIPLERQRPVFLVGAPGIGKTAIVEQVARELGIGLVSYSITHHTRQSALGLPYISEKNYGGRTYRVSEYTMSEIIAAVYDKIEETGVDTGILFLDEINCVSETLNPAMLQFLQYKVFGQHRVPDGWIVVTAGNPPEYNAAVREFDMVTSDRIKRIDIEPDYAVWRPWAVEQKVHQAVLSYLDIRKEDFYHVETTTEGRNFVTPRGWVDLSEMIGLYERNGIQADVKLFMQYLQDPAIARRFADYYELWCKYRSDYQVDRILAGEAGPGISERAAAAPFDERISLISLLFDGIRYQADRIVRRRETLLGVKKMIFEAADTDGLRKALRALEDETKGASRLLLEGKTLDHKLSIIYHLNEIGVQGQDDLETLKDRLREDVKKLKSDAADCSRQLENIFSFLERTFGKGPEIQLMMTELTDAEATASFIAQYGSDAYYRYNRELLFYERQKELNQAIDDVLQDSPGLDG